MKNSLYDIFAEKYGNEIYVTSDPHFGDLDCYKMRFPEAFSQHKIKTGKEEVEINLADYSDENIVKWLDDFQIKKINSKCGKNCTLIILGDI